MISLGDYIKSCIKDEGRTIRWVSEKLGINYKTFSGKLNTDSLSADELLKISVLIGINLEHLKLDLNYNSIVVSEYAYIVNEKVSEDEILNSDRISVTKVRIAGNRGISSDKLLNNVYLFIPVNNNFGKVEYELKLFESVFLKEEEEKGYMRKVSQDVDTYILSKSRLSGNVNISRPAISKLHGNVNISKF